VVAGDWRLMIGGGAQLPKPNGQIEPGSDKDALHAG
jgi:hypothetical protein